MSDKINIKENVIMAFVPTRDLVVFPNMTVYFDVGRSFSVRSIKTAMENDTPVFLAAQKDVNIENPEKKDCYAIGTVWFMVVTRMGIGESLMLCVVPFLIPDGVKIALAMILSNRLSKVVTL